MSWSRLEPGDVPVGLVPKDYLFTLFGELHPASGKQVADFSKQRELLGGSIWVWRSHEQPDGKPADAMGVWPLCDFIEALHDKLRHILQSARLPDNFPALVRSFAGQILDRAEKAPQACLAYFLAFGQPSSALRNQLFCAFSIAAMRTDLEISKTDCISLLCAALTMNLPILDLQDRLSSENRTPASGEKIAILRHPTDAEIRLAQAGVEDLIWLSCVLAHHEEPNGAGYPNKLRISELPSFHPMALRFFDRFSALTASRRHRSAFSVPAALSLMKDSGGFEPKWLGRFEFLLGPLPQGSCASFNGQLCLILDTKSNMAEALDLASLSPFAAPCSKFEPAAPKPLPLAACAVLREKLNAAN